MKRRGFLTAVAIILLVTGWLCGLPDQSRGAVQTSPVITNLSRSFGKSYDNIIVNGNRFGVSAKKVKVLMVPLSGAVKGTAEAYVITCQPQQIKFRIPPVSPGAYKVVVRTAAGSSNALNISVVLAPQIIKVSQTMTSQGSTVEISGSGYSFQGLQVKLVCGGISYPLTPQQVQGNKLAVVIPKQATPGKYLLMLSTAAGESNQVVITVGVKPGVFSLLPKSGLPGKYFYVYGRNLDLGSSIPKVRLGKVQAKVLTHTATKLMVQIPQLPPGKYSLVVNNGYSDSNAAFFQVKPAK